MKKRLPPTFAALFPQGTSIAYSIIPLIGGLKEPIKSQVQTAFAESLRVVWQMIIGVGGIGLLASLLMKGLPLHTEVDRKWGMKDDQGNIMLTPVLEQTASNSDKVESVLPM